MPTNQNNPHRYDDMLHMPHHVSTTHPQMTVLNRAAQFAPFAALSGYDAAISESARQTHKKIELDENSRELLDEKLQIVLEYLNGNRDDAQVKPEIDITYFIPDEKKEGGEYVTITAQIKKLDSYDHIIVTQDGMRIAIDDVLDLQSKIFCKFDK